MALRRPKHAFLSSGSHLRRPKYAFLSVGSAFKRPLGQVLHGRGVKKGAKRHKNIGGVSKNEQKGLKIHPFLIILALWRPFGGPNMHFYRLGATSGGPNMHFYRLGAPCGGPNMHFYRLGGGGVTQTILNKFDDI